MICVPWWVLPLVALLGAAALLGVLFWWWVKLYGDVFW